MLNHLKNAALLVCFSTLLAFDPGTAAPGHSGHPKTDYSKPEETYQVFIPGLVAADDFARAQISRIEELSHQGEGKRKHPSDFAVEITHFGNNLPTDLEWIIDHLKRRHIRVKLTLVKRHKALKILDEIESQIERAPLKIQYNVFYTCERELEKNPDTQKLVLQTRTAFKQALRTVLVHVRHFFGLPNGISWVMYRDSFTKRTAEEHLAELGSGAGQGLMMLFLQYPILMEVSRTNPGEPFYPAAGAGTAAAFKFITGYVERANNEFFVQGNRFNEEHLFSINRRFFLLAAYAHSIFIGQVVQTAARGWQAYTPDELIHTAWNSVLGLFAKAVPLYIISKNQAKYSVPDDSESTHTPKFQTILQNTVFNFAYQGLKTIHLFRFEFLNLSTLFVLAGLTGMGFEVWKHFNSGSGYFFPDRALDRASKDFLRLRRKIENSRQRKKYASCHEVLQNFPHTEFRIRVLPSAQKSEHQ